MKRTDLTIYEISDKVAKEMIEAIPLSMLEHCTIVKFAKGNQITKAGERVTKVFIMLKGAVSVSTSTEQGMVSSYLTMYPPTMISDLELLCDAENYLADVIATTDCIILVCSAELMKKELQINAKLLWHVSVNIAKNNHNLSNKNGRMAYQTGVKKVAYYLLEYCSEVQQKNHQYKLVDKTRMEMASELGVNVKTINRSIKVLKEQEMMTIENKKICITYQQYLKLKKFIK